MTEQVLIQSPSEILAHQIISRYICEGLITQEFSCEVKNLILSQSPSSEDWQLLVEKILESETKKD
jgi:hypothetical protein